MSENLDKQTVDWHSGFFAAASIVFKDEPYELYREYELNSKPIRIDVLIKSEAQSVSKMDIAKLFSKINIVEYKNPNDSLNYVQYYKTISYASLYVGNASNNVLPQDVTVSIFRDRYPKLLFEQLTDMGCKINEYKPGIYYVDGRVLFRTQIIVGSQLLGDEYLAFHALSDHLDKSVAVKLMSYAIEQTNPATIELLDSVFQVSMNVNSKIYADLKQEDPNMCQAFMEIFKDEIQAKINKAIADKDAKLAEKDARIAELEAALAAKKQA